MEKVYQKSWKSHGKVMEKSWKSHGIWFWKLCGNPDKVTFLGFRGGDRPNRPPPGSAPGTKYYFLVSQQLHVLFHPHRGWEHTSLFLFLIFCQNILRDRSCRALGNAYALCFFFCVGTGSRFSFVLGHVLDFLLCWDKSSMQISNFCAFLSNCQTKVHFMV